MSSFILGIYDDANHKRHIVRSFFPLRLGHKRPMVRIFIVLNRLLARALIELINHCDFRSLNCRYRNHQEVEEEDKKKDSEIRETSFSTFIADKLRRR